MIAYPPHPQPLSRWGGKIQRTCRFTTKNPIPGADALPLGEGEGR